MPEHLVAAILLPLVGSVGIALLNGGAAASRGIALLVSVVTFLFAATLARGYVVRASRAEWFADLSVPWIAPESGIDVQISLGLDGLSVWLFALSGLLMVSAVLVSWEAIQQRAALFYSMLLLLESGCLGVFAARDILLFYVFFEFTLIPLFFLIGIWGSEQRRYAAIKFFIFTLAGSLITFLGLLAIVMWNYANSDDGVLTFSIEELARSLAHTPLPDPIQLWIFIALFAGFAIKVPLFPLHTWLPLAHVQAPTAGSVILAGVLLKIGTYGFLRLSVPLLPHATAFFMPWMLWLSVVGIIYGALVALAQSDIKRLIAYSSVSHMGFCMLGMFSLNYLGTQGALLQMINHGISTGGLFAVVGMIYERYHTRQISELRGLARHTPWLAFFMLLFTLSSIGLPGLNGFAGEFLVLLGAFQRAWISAPEEWVVQFRWMSILALAGVVLGAWYMLWMIQRVFFGPPGESAEHGPRQVPDLSRREKWALIPLAVFVFWIGLYPKYFLQPVERDLQRLTEAARRQLDGHESGALVAQTNVETTEPNRISEPTTKGKRN